jgi:hypothetical protein
MHFRPEVPVLEIAPSGGSLNAAVTGTPGNAVAAMVQSPPLRPSTIRPLRVDTSRRSLMV